MDNITALFYLIHKGQKRFENGTRIIVDPLKSHQNGSLEIQTESELNRFVSRTMKKFKLH